MIEKFTPEELDIIMKELKELPHDKQKGTVCEDCIKFLRDLFHDQEEFKGIYISDVRDFIYSLADYVFCNYVKNSNKRDGYYRRNPLVPNEIADEYHDFVWRVCQLMPEFYRKSPVKKESVKGQNNEV